MMLYGVHFLLHILIIYDLKLCNPHIPRNDLDRILLDSRVRNVKIERIIRNDTSKYRSENIYRNNM